MATSLFMKAVGEGSGSNKLLQLLNPSAVGVDLSAFALVSCGNACSGGTYEYMTSLGSSILAAGATLTVCHGSFSAATPSFLNSDGSNCDVNTNYLSNGNDVWSLVESVGGATISATDASTYTVVDTFGELNDGSSSPNFQACGEDVRDNTFVRKASVTSGEADWAV